MFQRRYKILIIFVRSHEKTYERKKQQNKKKNTKEQRSDGKIIIKE